MGKNEAWFLCEPVLSWQRLGIKPMSAEVFCVNMSCRVAFFFSLMLSSLCPFFTPFILGPRLPSGCAALGHPAGPAVTRVRGSLGRPASAPTGSGRTAVAAAAAGRPAWRTGRAGCGGGWPTRGQDSFALLFVSPSKPVSLALHPPLLPSSICPRASRCRLAFFTHNAVLIFLFSLGRK